MKRLNYLMLIVLASLFTIVACEKDPVSEKDIFDLQKDLLTHQDSINRANQLLRDSLQKIGGIINYSVIVVDAGDAGFTKSANTTQGLGGVSISVSQYGRDTTITTGSNGIAVFSDLRIGNVAVNVKMDNYTEASFIADLTPANDPDIDNMVFNIRNAASKVPVFPLTGTSMATVSGLITYETDLTNNTREAAPSVVVTAAIDVDNPSFRANFIDNVNGSANSFQAGRIVSITYGKAVSRATSDASGAYSLQVPSTANGLPIRLDVSDVAANQTLLVNTLNGQSVKSAQQIRTIFSMAYDGVTASPSRIPTVSPVVVEISAPTGSSSLPTTYASATAMISPTGQIQYIDVSDKGWGYTQAPIVNIQGDGTGATATATLDANGSVASITVTNGGSGYTNANITLNEHGGQKAEAHAVLNYGITSIDVNSTGFGYKNVPAVEIYDATGSGAKATANILGYVIDTKIDNAGSGIVWDKQPDVIVSGGDPQGPATVRAYYTGALKETDFQPTTKNNAGSGWNDYYESVSDVTLRVRDQSGNTNTDYISGSGAILSVTLQQYGAIGSVQITNGGSGYNANKFFAATVTNPVQGNDKADIRVSTDNNGVVDAVYIFDSGDGYDNNVQVLVPNSNGNGTAATLSVTVVRRVQSINIVNGGTGYYRDHKIELDVNNNPNNPNWVDLGVKAHAVDNLSLTHLRVTDNGYGYKQGVPPSIIFIKRIDDNTSTLPAATANLEYYVNTITVDNPGTGYTDSPVINITGGGMTTYDQRCKASANVGNARIKQIVIDNPGTGYTGTPVVTIWSGGISNQHDQATATATVSAGRLTAINITSQASDYYGFAPNVEISFFKTEATGKVGLTTGSLTNVVIDDHGSGYTVAPIVEFEGGGGSGATATATINNGRVEAINITNAGTGYYYAPTVRLVTPENIAPARAYAMVSADGVISGLLLYEEGDGYVSVPTVTIRSSVNGVGSGATAFATIANGKVTGLTLTSGGTGYKAQNTPGVFGSSVDPTDSYDTNSSSGASVQVSTGGPKFDAAGGRSVIKDVYLGTGKRSIEQ